LARHTYLGWALAFSTLLEPACAPATRQTEVVPPSYETIVAEPEDSYDGIHQQIFISNRSSVAIVVTGFRLTECENVANPCGLKPLRIMISPHQRMLIATIGPEDRDRHYSYRYSWTWETAR